MQTLTLTPAEIAEIVENINIEDIGDCKGIGEYELTKKDGTTVTVYATFDEDGCTTIGATFMGQNEELWQHNYWYNPHNIDVQGNVNAASIDALQTAFERKRIWD